MHVVQTPGLPPNQGRMVFAIIGWTWKRRNALRKMVEANSIMGQRSEVSGSR
jgi:hypothetical protein